MAYYIGVDGGGTKTAYALFDERKNPLAEVTGPGSNHEGMPGSFAEAADILCRGIEDLLTPRGLTYNDITASLMGLAGMDHPYQHEEMLRQLAARGITRVRVVNDGFIVVKAGIGAGAGIGYNCGTGTCCNSVDAKGELRQIGGLGGLTGDVGGGWWVASETFRMVYDELGLHKYQSTVTASLGKEYGIKTLEDWMAAGGKLREESFRQRLIQLVFTAAEEGDEGARSVVEIMAARGADFLAGHVRRGAFDEDVIPVVLSGSIHVKTQNDYYVERLGALATAQTGRRFRFTKLTVPPVWGCIHWLLE